MFWRVVLHCVVSYSATLSCFIVQWGVMLFYKVLCDVIFIAVLPDRFFTLGLTTVFNLV